MPDGKVWMCVQLNESAYRERHILPLEEQTLAQTGEVKHFSKLDANSGIELDPETAKLTTFITLVGRFRFS